MSDLAVDLAIGKRRDASYAERSDLGWAMSAHNTSAGRRRTFIGLSSRSALLASAARRRLLSADLDAEERRSLIQMRDELRRTADGLRNGEPVREEPERTYAFSELATLSVLRPVADEPKREEYARLLDDIAHKIDALTQWDAPADAAVASEVADVFTTLSQVLLRKVSRTGESDSGSRRPGT